MKLMKKSTKRMLIELLESAEFEDAIGAIIVGLAFFMLVLVASLY